MADTSPSLNTGSPAEHLRIGQFSTLTRLSVRMLRHYDAHGVLSPAFTDPWTGYRSYDVAQLPDALFIRQLRDVGFGVPAIAALLPLRSDPDALGRALAVQRQQLVADAAQAQRRVAELDHLVSTLKEHTMTTITTAQIPAQQVVAVRMQIPNYPAEGLAWSTIMGEVGRQGVRPLDEPCGTTFYDDGYQEGPVDIEVWVPVAEGTSAAEPLASKELPACTAVVATVHGPFDLIGPACDELAEHMSDQGLTPAGPMFNRYLVGPARTKNPEEYVTEVCIPIA